VFAVVCIPNFALQALLRHEPELRARPVALIDAEGTNLAKSLVLECTRAAEAAGVSVGLTAPQAQARCRELVLKPRSPAAEKSATDILLQTAYAFSPHIESTAPGVCTIDLRGLNFGGSRSDETHPEVPYESLITPTAANDNVAQRSFEFFDSAMVGRVAPRAPELGIAETLSSDEAAARAERRALPAPVVSNWADGIFTALQRLGFDARLGIASTPNIALLAARAASPVLVIEREDAFFDSLPLDSLEPIPHVLDILKRWGIHTAGAFLALGKDAIADRLGAEALELFERASTDTIRPLNIIAPPDTFEEQIETLEPLLFVLRRFVEQLAARVTLSYRVIAELELKLELESGVPYERTFKVPAPTGNAETLFRMLHTHLESLRTDAPITSLELSAIPTRAEGQQFGLFESALRDPNHFHETLARLTALLGGERVGTPIAEPTHRPDIFRMKTPEFGNSQSATCSLKLETRNFASGLCLRRFRPAIHADVELKDGRPVYISTLIASGAVKRARGPWCNSGTWWDQRRWSRQEWDVETSSGEIYRLFNSNNDWLLEGVYD